MNSKSSNQGRFGALNISNKMLGIIIAILIAGASTIIGYFINSYLTREKLVIEKILIRPLEVSLPINKDIQQEIKKRFESWGRENPYVDKKVLQEDELIRLLAYLKDQISQYNASIKTYEEDLDNLDKPDADATRWIAKYGYLLPNSEPTANNLELIKANLTENIKSLKDANREPEGLIKRLIPDILEKAEREDFQINVVLLNYGDIQGLVQGSGRLIFDDDILNLKIMKNPSDRSNPSSFGQFEKVASRSFSMMTLISDEYNNRERMLDLAKREFLGGNRKAMLELNDVKGRTITYGPFFFRADLEYEKKESLKKRINREYTIFP